LSAAFDLIEGRIAEFGDGDVAATPIVDTTDPSPPPAPTDEMLTAIAEAAQTTGATDRAEAAASVSAMPSAPVAETVATAEAAEVMAQPAEAAEQPADMVPNAADDYDEAMLDMVALEMAAPDPIDIEDPTDTETGEIQLAESPPAEPEMTAQSPEPIAAPAQPPAPIQPSPEPSLEVSADISLGSSLIASGIVRKPTASQSDRWRRSGA